MLVIQLRRWILWKKNLAYFSLIFLRQSNLSSTIFICYILLALKNTMSRFLATKFDLKKALLLFRDF